MCSQTLCTFVCLPPENDRYSRQDTQDTMTRYSKQEIINCTPLDTRTRSQTHIHTHIHTYKHLHAHIHTHTHTHTRTHMHIQSPLTPTHVHPHTHPHGHTCPTSVVDPCCASSSPLPITCSELPSPMKHARSHTRTHTHLTRQCGRSLLR